MINKYVLFLRAPGIVLVFLVAGENSMSLDNTPAIKAPGPKRTPVPRKDRTPGNRGAYEAARKKILATQDVCGICGKPVDKSIKYPHPLSPTVDHIIPVSKGGHPSDISNLQLAHRCCNRQKSDKIMLSSFSLGEDTNKIIDNRVLEQHFDWKNYKSSKQK